MLNNKTSCNKILVVAPESPFDSASNKSTLSPGLAKPSTPVISFTLIETALQSAGIEPTKVSSFKSVKSFRLVIKSPAKIAVFVELSIISAVSVIASSGTKFLATSFVSNISDLITVSGAISTLAVTTELISGTGGCSILTSTSLSAVHHDKNI